MRRAVHDDDGQSEGSRRAQFGVISAGVLGDYELDRMPGHQRPLGRLGKWPACCDGGGSGRHQGRVRRIDGTQQVRVLWRRSEWQQALPPDRQEDAARIGTECLGRLCHSVDAAPVVARDRRPAGAPQHQPRNAGSASRRFGIGRDADSEGMRRIDQRRQALRPQIGGETGRSPEPAEAMGDRWRDGCQGARPRRTGWARSAHRPRAGGRGRMLRSSRRE